MVRIINHLTPVMIEGPPGRGQGTGNRLHPKAYGREEPVVELIPAILSAFVDSDRVVARTVEQSAVDNKNYGDA